MTSATVTFNHPFLLDEIEGILPAGAYRVETEEEALDSVSFMAYRRIATHIFVPISNSGKRGLQMCAIHPTRLAAASSRDKATSA